ncbi:MAG TPA: four helix bundle protein [Anaerolineales bacterium]|nr:four helix bundle protein [Anaerolineales bacterium]
MGWCLRLVLMVYAITKDFPDAEKYGLVSQMRRAAVSIPANVAEGYKRHGLQDKIRFYKVMDPKVRMYCNAPKKIANEEDILISVRAPVGPTNINSQKSCIGRGLAAIRAENGSDTKYLLYFLRYYEPKLAQLSKGSTFDAIGKDDLAKIPIPLPPLPEQQRIAAILDKADRVHRLRRYARVLQRYERLRAQQRDSGRQTEMLFGSLLALSFSERSEQTFV